tara:strand:- start:37 stop:903 length:867 start_codon:yes stop_codon:yes gene_type:complete
MGYDPLLGTVDSNIIKSSDIVENVDRLQKGLNGGYGWLDFDIGSIDESYSDRIDGAIKTHNILKPEFYGDPSPRVEMVTNDVHYRIRSNNYLDRYYRHEHLGFDESGGSIERFSAYQPIEGLSATFTCREQPKSVEVVICFHAYESEGEPGKSFSTDEFITDGYSKPFFHPGTVANGSYAGWNKAMSLNDVAAECRLFVETPNTDQPESVVATKRFIRCRGRDRYNSQRVQVRVHHLFTSDDTVSPVVRKGVNTISYQCRYRLDHPDDANGKHIIFESRSMIVNVNYK